MSSMLYSMIERRLKVVNISGKLFNVSASAVRYAFDQAREGAGISDLHFHDLRHTYGSRLYHMGVDLYTIKKLMGHKSLKMTERYVHENLEVLQPSAVALDKFYDNSTTVNEVVNLSKVEKMIKIN
ncbi:MAG: site-specific integrase [Nitrospirae bacterium]|nr:site-specific integrase [Nitrospirota bacterium]